MANDEDIPNVGNIRSNLRTKFIGRNVSYFESIDSTNRVAKEMAKDGAPEGTLVIADSQTAGRGRLNRQWLAPPGSGLLMSLIFRPQLAPAQAARVTMISSLAVVDAIEHTTPLRAQVKWPNDIVIRGRKAGGILTELGLNKQLLDFVVVGIGLNVNVDFEDRLPQYASDLAPDTSRASVNVLASQSTSLSVETGRHISRLTLLHNLLVALEKRYEALQAGLAPNEEWSRRLETLNRLVTVTTTDEVVTGRAEAVDTDGALIIRLADGGHARVLAGDVTLRTTPEI